MAGELRADSFLLPSLGSVHFLFNLCSHSVLCVSVSDLIRCLCAWVLLFLEHLFKNVIVATFLMQVPCSLLVLPPHSEASSLFPITLPILFFPFFNFSLILSLYLYLALSRYSFPAFVFILLFPPLFPPSIDFLFS